MLQHDAPQLQQALQDAGLKTSDSGLQFSLRDQSSSSGGRDNSNQSSNTRNLVISEDDTVPAVMAGRSYGRSLSSSEGMGSVQTSDGADESLMQRVPPGAWVNLIRTQARRIGPEGCYLPSWDVAFAITLSIVTGAPP